MSQGTFSGDPVTRWLSETGDDRNMEILEAFTFTDPAGKVWKAPVGSVVNGASIPRPLWSVVGSPYTGDYRRASIVHDVASVEADHDEAKRRAADRMFYHACRVGGCSVRARPSFSTSVSGSDRRGRRFPSGHRPWWRLPAAPACSGSSQRPAWSSTSRTSPRWCSRRERSTTRLRSSAGPTPLSRR